MSGTRSLAPSPTNASTLLSSVTLSAAPPAASPINARPYQPENPAPRDKFLMAEIPHVLRRRRRCSCSLRKRSALDEPVQTAEEVVGASWGES